MTAYQWIVVASWGIFVTYWLIAGLFVKKTVRRPGWSWRLGFAVLLFFIIKTGVFNGFGSEFMRVSPGPIVSFLGDLCVIFGVCLAIWARLYLGRNWGTPMSEKADTELVSTGPYHYVRHPIYSGVLLAIFGTAFVDGTLWLILFIAALIYFIYSARREEKHMLELFPEAYADYVECTSRLIPYIY